MRAVFSLFAVFFVAMTAFAASGGEQGPEVKLPGSDVIFTQQYLQRSFSLAKANAAFVGFLDKNPDWQFRFNEFTGNPHRAWGAGIPIDGFPEITLLSAPQAAQRFLTTHADLLNARPSELKLLFSDIIDGKAYVKYQQTFKGLDVLNSYVDLRISRDGRVFMFGSDFNPSIDVNPFPTIALDDAREDAKAGLTFDPATVTIEDGTLSVLPLEYPSHIEYHLVYNFRLAVSPQEIWDTYVDAHSGSILWRRNLVTSFSGHDSPVSGTMNTISGRITINVYKDSWLTGATVLPAMDIYVNVGGKEYVTDADGRFTADIGANLTAPVVVRLAGPYAMTKRADSTSAIKNARITTTASSGQELNIEINDANSVASERCTWYHMTVLRNYVRGLDATPRLIDMDKQNIGVVNINNQCNAFWDGSRLNFFKSSATCGNTGEIADVIYHEFGHGVNTFIYKRVKNTSLANGTLGEATADIMANMVRDDNRIGIGFMINGANDGIIRNSDNNRVYPRDLVNEIHDDGMILTGAMWDTRKAVGIDVARRLALNALFGTPDGTSAGEAFADYFLEVLIADDDNGNLADGTPHSADIIAAFVKHGIPASGITINHQPLPDQNSVTDGYPITGEILVGMMIKRGLLTINTMKVVYSTDGWQTTAEAPLTVDQSTLTFSGTIPAQRAGSQVRYYFTAVDNFGSQLTWPLTAPKDHYMFLVGYLSKVFYDCEATDGWTIESDAETGKWIRDKPVGTWNTQLGNPPDVPYVQPNEDHTIGLGKDKCWVTGNAPIGADLGTNDVDNGYVNLFTRLYDVSTMKDPVIRYYRWFSNDQGANPGVAYWNVRLSSDGGTTWKWLEQTHVSEMSWKPYVFRLRDYIDLTPTMQVWFSTADSITDKQSLVEAAVDDFEILDINEDLINGTDAAGVPGKFDLEQNFPNPFNPSTTLSFSLPVDEDAVIRVFSPVGREVALLSSGRFTAGRHSLTFNAASLPSGTYTYVLEAGGRRSARTMVLLK